MLRRTFRDRASRLASFLLLVAVIGEAGHLGFDQLNAEIAHHFFHILFPLVAFVVFGVFVARDIRLHGWPAFSWRLSQTAERRVGSRLH